ncbi:MAG: NADH-quinone oxidoreductase subunit M [Planctomycetes bacterium]|nr:NADH-quinone oxidoreductase subunit M [Planctomycetota bacterium]MBL7040247.1 NADH-quinone oxidoreductase subunit M [Pirellulaceae bacterium]
MANLYILLLSAIVFLPTLGAIALIFFPKDRDDSVRYFTLFITAVVFALTVLVFLTPMFGDAFQYETEAAAHMQYVFNVPWIPSFDIDYFMGVDGISFPLIMLTALISLLAMGASWSVTKHVKGYCILFLLLETGMIGVFLSLDFFLFYVFWEVMLLPMYFLIGVWGGPRREYAAIKFFLYTLLGSVLMLIAILMLYFNSDLVALRELSNESGSRVNWEELHISDAVTEDIEAELAARSDEGHEPQPIHTFNLLAMTALGQNAEGIRCIQEDDKEIPDEKEIPYGYTCYINQNLQWWCFLLLFIGFIIKVPSVPFHTWLPDAHVEAPTPISMILAGVLLKMGGYGIIRICYPICPHGGYDLMWFVCILGVVSMVYGAFAAMAQKDFKRLVAYSSVSHMGYVVLGLGVWSATAGTMYNSDYWNMGVKGAMFQMIAHGISSAGMFFMVGVVYDRVHHRDLNSFGALFGKMPVYTALSIGIFFAGLGLPGLCGFIGEVLVVLSVWNFSYALAVISASVVILTAGYILWTVQRVYLGHEYKGAHEEALVPSTTRENSIAGVLFVLAILFGVFPHFFLLRYMDGTIDRQVDELATWTETVKEQEPAVQADADEDELESEPRASLDGRGGDKVSFAGGMPQVEANIRLAGGMPNRGKADIQQERLLP